MNTPWTLEEQTKWPFDLTIKNASGEILFSLGRCAYSSTHDGLDDVYAGRGMGKNQAEAVKCNAAQKAQLDGIICAVNSHDALVAALEDLVSLSESLVVRAESWPSINAAKAALKLARGEQ